MNAQEEFNAFLALQAVPGYVLGDIKDSADADMKEYTILKIAVSQEAEVLKAFNAEWDAKVSELRVKHDEETIALNKEKQAAIDLLL